MPVAELTDRYTEDPLAHAEYTLRTTTLQTWPFRHAVVEPVFPRWYYQQLITNFPEQSAFTPINEYHPDRGGLFLTDRGDGTTDLDRIEGDTHAFWTDFVDRFCTERFRRVLLETVAGPESAAANLSRTRSLVHLSLDQGGYKIDPHTDIDRKVVTAVIYLPDYGDERVAPYGTSVLVEKPGTTIENEQDWDRYEVARTASFAANTMFTFARADNSWHAVKPVEAGIERRSIQYFVFIDE